MKIFKRVVIFSMLAAFLVSTFTGIVKTPELKKYFTWVYDFISASNLYFIHDWSGIIFVILIIVHLILTRKWFREALGDGPKREKLLKIIFAILIALLIFLGAYALGRKQNNKKTVNLAPVEVREYQGEKLGSVNDFRENSIKGVQKIDKSLYRLQISGLVNSPVSLDYADVLKFQPYQKVVTLNCVEGWSVKALWKGVLVRDVIAGAGAKPEAKTIIFYAQDGYSTSFPLDYVMKNDIIMAYNLNGIELPPERGFPFQLVAEDKWGYKWIKWITKIELSDNIDYKGYWESRGYNNNGDLSGSQFE